LERRAGPRCGATGPADSKGRLPDFTRGSRDVKPWSFAAFRSPGRPPLTCSPPSPGPSPEPPPLPAAAPGRARRRPGARKLPGRAFRSVVRPVEGRKNPRPGQPGSGDDQWAGGGRPGLQLNVMVVAGRDFMPHRRRRGHERDDHGEERCAWPMALAGQKAAEREPRARCSVLAQFIGRVRFVRGSTNGGHGATPSASFTKQGRAPQRPLSAGAAYQQHSSAPWARDRPRRHCPTAAGTDRPGLSKQLQGSRRAAAVKAR